MCTWYGGGSGSGYGCLLGELSLNRKKTVLCMHSSSKHTDFAVVMDNEALDIELNRLLAQVISY